MVTGTASPAAPEREGLDSLATLLLLAIIVLAPIARGWVLWSAPGGDEVNQWVLMTAVDWPLALLVVLQLARFLEEERSDLGTLRRSLPAPVQLTVAALAWLSIAALAHPSWRALDLAFRLIGIGAIVQTVRRGSHRERDAFLTALVLLGVLQAALGIAQSLSGEALGLGVLEFEGPLYEFGSASAGRGSLTHPYHLTALLVVCVAAGGLLASRIQGRAKAAALVAMALMSTGIVLTFSRSGFLAVVAMVVLWALRRHTALLAGAVVAGVLLGAVLGFDGLTAKADASTDAARVDSGRRERLREAFELASEEPVLGVGPGRYVIALRNVEHDDLLPAHNLIAQQAAESGYPGGVLVLAAFASFGWWLLHRSAMTMAVAASLVPFHLLDAYPHTFPLGLVISGFWLAALLVSFDAERAASQPARVGG